jgi:hypothetical protein
MAGPKEDDEVTPADIEKVAQRVVELLLEAPIPNQSADGKSDPKPLRTILGWINRRGQRLEAQHAPKES